MCRRKCDCQRPDRPVREDDRWREIGSFPSQTEVERAKKVFDGVHRFLLRQPGVTAVDVGFQLEETSDRFSSDVAVRVHVENKLESEYLRQQLGRCPIAELEFERLGTVESVNRTAVPRRVGLREVEEQTVKLDRVPIDVIEARYLPSSLTNVRESKLNTGELDGEELSELVRSPIQPLVGGISVGRRTGPAGTLGAVVWDRTDGTPCILSNWHVLSGSLRRGSGEPCFQPANFDGGRSADRVARLKRWLFDQHGDAALAQIESDRTYNVGEILGLWVPVPGTVEPRLGMPMRKFSRSTGFTEGFIDGLYFTTDLEYERIGVRRFVDQIHIAARYRGEEVSAPGDSGAIWVTKYVPHPAEIGGNDESHDSAELSEPGSSEDKKTPEPDAKREPRTLPEDATGAGYGPGDPPEPASAKDEEKLGSDAQLKRSALPEDAPADESGDAAARPEEPACSCWPLPRRENRVYYGVGLHFAGDLPGSKSGEFAVASSLQDLTRRLRFSFRPVFFPASEFVVASASAIPTAEESSSPEGGRSGLAGGRGNPTLGPQPETDAEDPPPEPS